MEHAEVEKVQVIVEKNFAAMVAAIPQSLQKQEDELVGTFKKHTGNYLSRLKSLYEFMDTLSEYMGKHAPCKKGCSHCCNIRVSISEMEAEFIRKQEGIKPSKPIAVGETHGTPCPFLKKGTCSIYKSRPFLCRQHISTYNSSDLCRVEVCNDVTVKFPRFTEVRAVYESLLKESGLANRFDIRALFPVRK